MKFNLDDHVIEFIACRCTAWPILSTYGYGRCHRCGVRPNITIGPRSKMNREQAIILWETKYKDV